MMEMSLLAQNSSLDLEIQSLFIGKLLIYYVSFAKLYGHFLTVFCFFQQDRQSGFMPPGRPKNWRKKAFEVLELSVATRIEGTRVDEREDNKMWLVRYLELIRQLILEDLRVVKTLCVPCFPPHYDIVNQYVLMYHTCLSTTVGSIYKQQIK